LPYFYFPPAAVAGNSSSVPTIKNYSAKPIRIAGLWKFAPKPTDANLELQPVKAIPNAAREAPVPMASAWNQGFVILTTNVPVRKSATSIAASTIGATMMPNAATVSIAMSLMEAAERGSVSMPQSVKAMSVATR
jgi:hypothetical protein